MSAKITTSPEQNKKRIKRNKIPLPTKVYIRPNADFKKYVTKFNENKEKFGYSHKFLVREHFRHFHSDRYTRKQGDKTWIRPYWKGEGIVISKEYKLIGDKST